MLTDEEITKSEEGFFTEDDYKLVDAPPIFADTGYKPEFYCAETEDTFDGSNWHNEVDELWADAVKAHLVEIVKDVSENMPEDEEDELNDPENS